MIIVSFKHRLKNIAEGLKNSYLLGIYTGPCNVNEPSLGWLGVDLLWALSADSNCVCLYDMSLIKEPHYRVLIYRYLIDVAKNMTWCQEVLSNL